jgi:hypothetical protein
VTTPSRLIEQATELMLAAPQVIALRVAGMMAGGTRPDAKARREYHRMGLEKVVAFEQSAMAMTLQMVRVQRQWHAEWMQQWIKMLATPWWSVNLLALASALPNPGVQRAWFGVAQRGIAPIHRRATANLRRLRKP